MIDFEGIQKDFPILSRKINSKPIVFLDSGASSQKPVQVIDAMDNYYRMHHANIHRGIYVLSAEATEMYDQARRKVARFINSKSWREVIFTRNTTESINLVAYSWGDYHLKQGDVILTTEIEHHANLIPWQQLCQRRGATLRFIPVDHQGYLVLDNLDRLLEGVKLVAFTAMSNVLGTITPVKEIIDHAHKAGAIVLVDGAQSVPHSPTDVQEMDCDFLVFSGHKMLGPTGIGVLYGKKEILSNMPPFLTGGDMILSVDYDTAVWDEIPQKFEAGTPAIAEAVGLGAAIDYLNKLGMQNIRQHEMELTQYALQKLSLEEGIRIYGPMDPKFRGGIVTFNLGDIHPHDLSSILDTENIAIRAGHHCAMPLHKKLNLTATARASLYVYNSVADIDCLIKGLEKARKIFS